MDSRVAPARKEQDHDCSSAACAPAGHGLVQHLCCLPTCMLPLQAASIQLNICTSLRGSLLQQQDLLQHMPLCSSPPQAEEKVIHRGWKD